MGSNNDNFSKGELTELKNWCESLLKEKDSFALIQYFDKCDPEQVHKIRTILLKFLLEDDFSRFSQEIEIFAGLVLTIGKYFNGVEIMPILKYLTQRFPREKNHTPKPIRVANPIIGFRQGN